MKVTLPKLPIQSLYDLTTKKLHPRKGRLLVASPFLFDMFFPKTVILLTEHSRDGTAGLVLNKPQDLPVGILIKDLANYPEFVIHKGGPVQLNSLFYLHTFKDLPNAIPVNEDLNLYWGGDINELIQLIKEGKATPENTKFFLGYSGWAPLQLSKEMKEESWFVLEPQSQEDLFKIPERHKGWQYILKKSGVVHPLAYMMPERLMDN
ncbi:MAG: YqgE/AlgH family protein [Chlorobi bacterium]|nr:YqgE/AlgH family protein [Chlorobiota bacterium]